MMLAMTGVEDEILPGKVSFIELATASFLFISLSISFTFTNAIHATIREVNFYLGFSFLVLLERLRHFSFWALRCAAPFVYASVFRIHNLSQ